MCKGLFTVVHIVIMKNRWTCWKTWPRLVTLPWSWPHRALYDMLDFALFHFLGQNCTCDMLNLDFALLHFLHHNYVCNMLDWDLPCYIAFITNNYVWPSGLGFCLVHFAFITYNYIWQAGLGFCLVPIPSSQIIMCDMLDWNFALFQFLHHK